MRIAIISPTHFLKHFSTYRDNQYHMVLAHRFLTDRAYSRFYIDQKSKGGFVILDNGACELKSSISARQLSKAMTTLQPDVLVLPDVLDEGDATVRRSLQFIDEYSDVIKKIGINLMAVPQGRTKNEWVSSFSEFLNSPEISYIGISSVKALNINNSLFDRADAIKLLQENGYDLAKKKIHILGLGDSGHEEIKKLRKYKFIEGLDTSAPVVHGYYSVKFEHGKSYKKIPLYLPDDLIDINTDQISLIKHNIDVIYDLNRS